MFQRAGALNFSSVLFWVDQRASYSPILHFLVRMRRDLDSAGSCTRLASRLTIEDSWFLSPSP